MNQNSIRGHLAALITIFIWATTYISTKILLEAFQAIEILVFRFIMGYFVLLLVCPKKLKTKNAKQEITFVAAGFCGICLYYLLENIALTYTMASNVGVIISIAPFFTAVLAHFLIKREGKITKYFVIGFVVAMMGIGFISFNGAKMEINPIGDLLAVLAAIVWALYSLLTRKISEYGYSVILSTRRTFFYGILFMLPTLFWTDFTLGFERFSNMTYLYNLIYLGVGASALCFVTWNFAVKVLGAVKTSVYIYLVPVITVVTSSIILNEKLTVLSVIGTILTMSGLFLSEYKKGCGNKGVVQMRHKMKETLNSK